MCFLFVGLLWRIFHGCFIREHACLHFLNQAGAKACFAKSLPRLHIFAVSENAQENGCRLSRFLLNAEKRGDISPKELAASGDVMMAVFLRNPWDPGHQAGDLEGRPSLVCLLHPTAILRACPVPGGTLCARPEAR